MSSIWDNNIIGVPFQLHFRVLLYVDNLFQFWSGIICESSKYLELQLFVIEYFMKRIKFAEVQCLKHTYTLISFFLLNERHSNNEKQALINIFAWFWWHSSLDSQNYYIAMWVKRQVWFGDTVQISLVLESCVLCHQNHAKIINSGHSEFLFLVMRLREGFKKKKCGIFRTLVGWVGGLCDYRVSSLALI